MTELIKMSVESGQVELLIAPTIDEDLPAEVREGLARRRLCFTTGRCPCGAVFHRPNRAERRANRGWILQATVLHEPTCPALDPRLDDLAAS